MLTTKATKAAIAIFLLMNISACANNAHTAPTMLDFSYIPPNTVTSATHNYGIDDF